MARTLTNRVRPVPGRFMPAKQWGNIRSVRSAPMEVVIVRWPAERERREQLRRGGRPRLLLLEDGAPPPDPDDCLEDWARAPIDEADLRARVAALELRASF